MTDIPVKGAVLQWARKFRGLGDKEAAKMLGISVSELHAYEKDKLPSLTMFEKFAAQYRLPQATLFRLTPPPEPPKPKDFRTIEGKKPEQSFEFSVALSNVRTLTAQYQRIALDDEEFEIPELPHITRETDPAAAGERERKRLGVSVEQQLGWPHNEAFRRWRAILEARGISVFQQKFPLKDCKGFTLYDTQETPTIVLNRTEDLDVAKTFTLIHEYGHLLLRQPGISNEDARNPVEAFCNKFAAAFLIPVDALHRLLPYLPNRPIAWKSDDIDGWASRLKVSRIALALRLEQLGFAPDGYHLKFKHRGSRTKRRGATGGDHVATQLSDIGANYTKQIIQALERDVIDRSHAAEALGLSVENFTAARVAIRRHRELAAVG
jgi:Zn-dependent peptidase ImmA (M78 family)